MVAPRPERITPHFISSLCERLAENKHVRRRLPVWGRVHIDRQLPFLCVYRRPEDRSDPGTDRLVLGEASYLLASGERRLHKPLSSLVQEIAATLARHFGAFFILEIWSSTDGKREQPDLAGVLRPAFRIFPPNTNDLFSTVEVLENSLLQTKIRKQSPEVEIAPAGKVTPPGLPALLSRKQAADCGTYVVGLEIRPVYRDRKKGTLYPLLLRAVHRQLYRAFKQAFFEFTRNKTTQLPEHYQALGRRSLVQAVWEVDRRLAEVSNSYDFLLAVTPVNSRRAWAAFRRYRYDRIPRFVYRAVPVAPGLLKRKLFDIPVEQVEDPVLAQIFREKQNELDRQLTALLDRETKRFLYASLQLYGGVDDDLLRTAQDMLDRIPPHSREASSAHVGAAAFSKRAEEEFAYFRETYPEFSAKISLRGDIAGLMVSRGNLLVPSDAKIPASRVEALIQHEVGTHVLTYHNGRSQRFRQLYSGLAGYEELQEGLAVLAEYLTGGLSLPRVRLLAARVIAARRLVEGASFIETFRELDRSYEFSGPAAFSITMRTFRGGGLTKDALYLRGLIRLQNYLRKGGELEPLLVGKISVENVPVVRELLWRQVLHPPPLRPRYLEDANAQARLKRVREAATLFELIDWKRRR